MGEYQPEALHPDSEQPDRKDKPGNLFPEDAQTDFRPEGATGPEWSLASMNLWVNVGSWHSVPHRLHFCRTGDGHGGTARQA